MIKRTLIILIIINMILIMSGCGLKAIVRDTATLNEVEGVTMTIKDGSLTRNSAKIIIVDLTKNNNIYGSWYRIDKKENNEWKELQEIDHGLSGWAGISYMIGKDNKIEMDINWENLYGKLENGEYRIVKDLNFQESDERHYFSVEFIIQ